MGLFCSFLVGQGISPPHPFPQSLTLQRLALESILHRRSKKMRVTGPLASVFANAFKKDAATTIEPLDFTESTATALCGLRSLQGQL